MIEGRRPGCELAENQDIFRAEARGMAESYAEALLEHASPGSVEAVHLKGSSIRRWDSEIDYVPELSDVDIHVRFHGWAEGRHGLGSGQDAAAVAETAEVSHADRFPQALHTPRVQLSVLNELERHPDYVHSPSQSVETLFGAPYPERTREAYRGVVEGDRRLFLADAGWTEIEVPWKLIDRPGSRAWEVVRILSWRIGPAGPRFLTQLGLDPFDAWSMNRTALAGELDRRAGPDVGGAYRAFYRAGWDGFRDRFSSRAPALRAVEAAEDFFRAGRSRLEEVVRGNPVPSGDAG